MARSAKPRHVPVDPQLAELGRELGDRGLVAIHRIRRNDWTARTLDGTVGRGESMGEAIAALLLELQPGRRQPGPDLEMTEFARLMESNRGV